MKLLAVDTATEACSVALAIGSDVHSRYAEAPREHGDRLLAMIDAVLADAGCTLADLDAIAFGRGPGAFTGVRIATGVVQGIAFGRELPVIPVSNLAVLAQGGFRRHGVLRLLPAIDARMGEVYWGPCEIDDAGIARVRGTPGESVAAPQDVPSPTDTGWYGLGTGWASHADALARRVGRALAGDLGHALPDARDMLVLACAAWGRGEAVAAEDAVPVYLRDRVARKTSERGQ